MNKTEEEWKKDLTPEQYKILRERGTEAPFTGQYLDHHEDGMYTTMVLAIRVENDIALIRVH